MVRLAYPKNSALFALWQKFEAKFGSEYRFGYAFKELYYNHGYDHLKLSVTHKRTGKSHQELLELGASTVTCKDTWVALMVKLGHKPKEPTEPDASQTTQRSEGQV